MSRPLQPLLAILIACATATNAQDTFSIVAVDSVTNEVGSAGASCVDLFNSPGYANDFLGELFPGVGAINTQASYDPANQANARIRMNAGDTPAQIISWLVTHDVAANPAVRQYGVVRLVGGLPQTAGYTGASCLAYKNNIEGPEYSIQGNILLGAQVLDSMVARFNAEPGDLACKLMAALQGAKMPGADTRCAPNGTSTLFAFLKVSQPTDTFGSPSFIVSLKTHAGAGIEPIDSLQILFDLLHSCTPAGVNQNYFIQNNFEIFPNPSSNEFNILRRNYNSTEAIIVIKDFMGKKIFEGKIKNKITINSGEWSRGAYFVEITDGKFSLIKKFIKI